MEKQEMEAKWKPKWNLETETGTVGLEKEVETHRLLVQYFLHGLMSSVLCHYSYIARYLGLLSNGYAIGHVLCLYL